MFELFYYINSEVQNVVNNKVKMIFGQIISHIYTHPKLEGEIINNKSIFTCSAKNKRTYCLIFNKLTY